MPLPTPHPGLVLHYSYLWHDERLRGLEEGVKNRPCVVVSALSRSSHETIVTLVPVTHRAPRSLSDAVEIPRATKERLRLDVDRSWIVVTEVNRFQWPGPDLRPIPNKGAGNFAYGVIPPGLFAQVKAGLLHAAGARVLRTTQRS